MFGWCNLFAHDREMRSGGPCSFHKFNYLNSTIILIGSTQRKIPSNLFTEYSDVFKLFFEKNPVKIFLGSNEKLQGFTTFLDAMRSFSLSENLEIMSPDMRYFDEGFFELFFFLEVAEFSSSVENHLDHLLQLELQYSKLDLKISQYFVKNYFALCDEFNILDEIIEKNKACGYHENEIQKKSLIELCVEILNDDKTFDPIAKLRNFYKLYLVNFLTVSLFQEIWEEKHNKIFIVVTKHSHTQQLAAILKSVCDPLVEINATKDEVLSAKIIRESLERHGVKRMCAIM